MFLSYKRQRLPGGALPEPPRGLRLSSGPGMMRPIL
jgi:hypothetical protein